jgi:hypothetical protein
MKIRNMKISTRLYLALAVILMLTMVLAWEAQNTKSCSA